MLKKLKTLIITILSLIHNKLYTVLYQRKSYKTENGYLVQCPVCKQSYSIESTSTYTFCGHCNAFIELDWSDIWAQEYKEQYNG